ncbi:MAG: DNA gyrase inhibitor YacG [Planctomycetia bacterium]
MARCPVCSATVNLTALTTPPFCSERCRVIDLGRWLDEAYAVPEIRRGDDEGDGEGAIPPELLRQDEDDHEA